MDFGLDTYVLDGRNDDAGTAEGTLLVLAALWRRITTDPQSLAGRRIYRSRCYDLRKLQGSRWDQARLASEEGTITEALRNDARVDEAAALFSFEDRRLRVRVQVRLVDGQVLDFVGDIATLSMEVLTRAADAG